MRVVQINAVLGYGSTGKIVQDISQMLDERGVENYIFYAEGISQNKNAINVSNKFDRKIHALMSHLTGLQAYFSKKQTALLIERLDSISPDVVHLHNLHHNYINLNMLLAFLAKKNIKTVLTLHDCWFFTGKCTHYSYIGCEKWKDSCGKCAQLKKDNASFFFDRTAKILADKRKAFKAIKDLEVVGVSEWMANQAKKSLLQQGNISVIHNGIDTSIFTTEGIDYREDYGFKDKIVILGMANKWLKEENSGLLEYVLENLGEQYVMVMIGGKDIKLPRVKGIDFVTTQEELAKVYRTADIFVNVTHEDSLPTVNLEAMGCGVPVVTYGVCGSTETVTEKTGAVVSENDRVALVTAIKNIGQKNREELRKNCRQHCIENYNKKIEFAKYYEEYGG